MNNYQAYDYMARSAQVMHEGLSILNDFSSHPANPFSYTWPGKVTKASLETAMRLTRRYEKIGFNIDEVTIDDNTYLVKEEVAFAIKNNFKPISLGNQRLRTETAGLVACHTLSLINRKV